MGTPVGVVSISSIRMEMSSGSMAMAILGSLVGMRSTLILATPSMPSLRAAA